MSKVIYHLASQKKQLLNAKGLGIGNFDWLFEKIESSRSTNLARFLLGIGIQGMGPESAKKLDEYFGKSFKRFEEAIKNEYEFNQIEGISVSLNNKIYDWYYSEKEQAIWMPLITGKTSLAGVTPTLLKSPLSARSKKKMGKFPRI